MNRLKISRRGAIVLSLGSIVATFVQTVTKLVLSPILGLAGVKVTVSGSGFPRGTIQITWDGSNVGMPLARVSGSGRFSTSMTVPANASIGEHTIGAGTENLPFIVQDAAPTPTPTPVPTPTPSPIGIAAPVGPFTERDGAYAADSGEFLWNAGGGAIQKLYVKKFKAYGIANMHWQPIIPPEGRTLVEDCISEDITSDPPKSMGGTGEAGFWFGNPTDARRLIARRASWMGMWTGAVCYDSIIEDFQLLEMPNVGLYVEHVTRGAIFKRGKIESAGTGINVEWWYGGQGSSMLIFEDLDIYCPAKNGDWTRSGMFLDAGTFGCQMRRIHFWGPGDAIGLPNIIADPSKPNIVDAGSCIFDNLGQKIWYHNNPMG